MNFLILSSGISLGFPCGSAGKESACNVGNLGSIPGLERSPGEGKGFPLQYSGLENSMDCIVHGVAESDMTEQLSLCWHVFRALIQSRLHSVLSLMDLHDVLCAIKTKISLWSVLLEETKLTEH